MEPEGKRAEPSGSPYLSHAVADAFRGATERALLESIRSAPVPRHLAIIMDGNRRFASDHGLLIQEGHARGKDKLEDLLNWCLEVQVKILTVYALSTENFRRPESELRDLMALFARSFREIASDERVHKHDIRVRAIGNRAVLPQEVRDAIELAESATKDYTSYFYNVAIAYGGREEIVEAIRTIAREVEAGRSVPTRSTRPRYRTDSIRRTCPTRTSSSGRAARSGSPTSCSGSPPTRSCTSPTSCGPGLSKVDFLKAIRAFQNRQRRYGT